MGCIMAFQNDSRKKSIIICGPQSPICCVKYEHNPAYFANVDWLICAAPTKKQRQSRKQKVDTFWEALACISRNLY